MPDNNDFQINTQEISSLRNSINMLTQTLARTATAIPRATASAISDYNSKIKEEIDINEKHAVGMAAGLINPIFGYLTTQALETETWAKMKGNAKRGIGSLTNYPVKKIKQITAQRKKREQAWMDEVNSTLEDLKSDNNNVDISKIPKAARGGKVKKDGLVYVHKGEKIVPATSSSSSSKLTGSGTDVFTFNYRILTIKNPRDIKTKIKTVNDWRGSVLTELIKIRVANKKVLETSAIKKHGFGTTTLGAQNVLPGYDKGIKVAQMGELGTAGRALRAFLTAGGEDNESIADYSARSAAYLRQINKKLGKQDTTLADRIGHSFNTVLSRNPLLRSVTRMGQWGFKIFDFFNKKKGKAKPKLGAKYFKELKSTGSPLTDIVANTSSIYVALRSYMDSSAKWWRKLLKSKGRESWEGGFGKGNEPDMSMGGIGLSIGALISTIKKSFEDVAPDTSKGVNNIINKIKDKLPKAASGGDVKKTGAAIIHKGEKILPAAYAAKAKLANFTDQVGFYTKKGAHKLAEKQLEGADEQRFKSLQRFKRKKDLLKIAADHNVEVKPNWTNEKISRAIAAESKNRMIESLAERKYKKSALKDIETLVTSTKNDMGNRLQKGTATLQSDVKEWGSLKKGEKVQRVMKRLLIDTPLSMLGGTTKFFLWSLPKYMITSTIKSTFWLAKTFAYDLPKWLAKKGLAKLGTTAMLNVLSAPIKMAVRTLEFAVIDIPKFAVTKILGPISKFGLDKIQKAAIGARKAYSFLRYTLPTLTIDAISWVINTPRRIGNYIKKLKQMKKEEGSWLNVVSKLVKESSSEWWDKQLKWWKKTKKRWVTKMYVTPADILEQKHMNDLRQLASELGIKGFAKLNKKQLVKAIQFAQSKRAAGGVFGFSWKLIKSTANKIRNAWIKEAEEDIKKKKDQADAIKRLRISWVKNKEYLNRLKGKAKNLYTKGKNILFDKLNQNNIPKFASGTGNKFIKHTGLAILHKGEKVVTSSAVKNEAEKNNKIISILTNIYKVNKKEYHDTRIQQRKERYHWKKVSRHNRWFKLKTMKDNIFSMLAFGFGLVKDVFLKGINLLSNAILTLAASNGLSVMGGLKGKIAGLFTNGGRLSKLSPMMKFAGPLAISAGAGMGLSDMMSASKNARSIHDKKKGEKVLLSEKVTAGLGGFFGGNTKGGIKSAAKGALKGGTIGAGIGSMIVPGVGTMIGGAIGTIAGGLLGFLGGKNIAKSLQGVWKGLKKLIKGIWKFVTFPFRLIWKVLKAGWNFIKLPFTNPEKFVDKVFAGGKKILKFELWMGKKLFSLIKMIGKGAWWVIKSVGKGIINLPKAALWVSKKLISLAWWVIKAPFRLVWATLKGGLKLGWNITKGITNLASIPFRIAWRLIKLPFTLMKKAADKALKKIKDFSFVKLFTSFKDSIFGAIISLVEKIPFVGSTAAEWLRKKFLTNPKKTGSLVGVPNEKGFGKTGDLSKENFIRSKRVASTAINTASTMKTLLYDRIKKQKEINQKKGIKVNHKIRNDMLSSVYSKNNFIAGIPFSDEMLQEYKVRYNKYIKDNLSKKEAKTKAISETLKDNEDYVIQYQKLYIKYQQQLKNKYGFKPSLLKAMVKTRAAEDMEYWKNKKVIRKASIFDEIFLNPFNRVIKGVSPHISNSQHSSDIKKAASKGKIYRDPIGGKGGIIADTFGKGFHAVKNTLDNMANRAPTITLPKGKTLDIHKQKVQQKKIGVTPKKVLNKKVLNKKELLAEILSSRASYWRSYIMSPYSTSIKKANKHRDILLFAYNQLINDPGIDDPDELEEFINFFPELQHKTIRLLRQRFKEIQAGKSITPIPKNFSTYNKRQIPALLKRKKYISKSGENKVTPINDSKINTQEVQQREANKEVLKAKVQSKLSKQQIQATKETGEDISKTTAKGAVLISTTNVSNRTGGTNTQTNITNNGGDSSSPNMISKILKGDGLI